MPSITESFSMDSICAKDRKYNCTTLIINCAISCLNLLIIGHPDAITSENKLALDLQGSPRLELIKNKTYFFLIYIINRLLKTFYNCGGIKTVARSYKRLAMLTFMAMLMLMILAQGAFGSFPCIAKELDKTFGAPGDGAGNSIQQTSDGGYIIAGSIRSNTADDNDVFLIKTDKDGSETWNRTFGGSRDDEGYSVLQASDGGYLVIGSTRSFGAGGYDIWAIRTDKDGSETAAAHPAASYGASEAPPH